MRNSLRKRKSLFRFRQGATAVEFAIASSLAFMLFFAALEFCRIAMFRHTVEHALYEGARAGIVPGATASEVTNKTQEILRRIGINHAAVDVTPAAIDNTTREVSVRVRMALDRGLFAPAFYFVGKSLDRTLVMQREGVE